jgi:bla regulator protein blaR1
MKAIHEFLADQYAISDSDRYAYAELLVLQTLKANHIPISNYFFQNHIKRRIAMITNNQSTRISYRSRLMALPVIAFLFCTIALYAQRSSTNTATKFNFSGSALKPITVVIDAGHGGIDPGASSIDGKVKEKDLALQISQKIQQLAPSYNINIVMTRTGDHLPGNTSVIADGLKARTKLAQTAKADLFVAIHVSATDGQNTHPDSGFEIFLSNKDNSNTQKAKQLGSAVLQELSKIYSTNTTLLQKERNIWVLEQSPCPALLIECGFITNDKDLVFISNSSNQETIAKKILEGIVKYKDNPAAAVNQVKRAFDKKPNLSGYTPQSAQYFFQVNFQLQKRQC